MSKPTRQVLRRQMMDLLCFANKKDLNKIIITKLYRALLKLHDIEETGDDKYRKALELCK